MDEEMKERADSYSDEDSQYQESSSQSESEFEPSELKTVVVSTVMFEDYFRRLLTIWS